MGHIKRGIDFSRSATGFAFNCGLILGARCGDATKKIPKRVYKLHLQLLTVTGTLAMVTDQR